MRHCVQQSLVLCVCLGDQGLQLDQVRFTLSSFLSLGIIGNRVVRKTAQIQSHVASLCALHTKPNKRRALIIIIDISLAAFP